MKEKWKKISRRLTGSYDFKGKYTARDVANYIVKECSDHDLSITNLQLQKILYYIQVHFLQEEKRALFSDDIEAWQFGPVVRDVYDQYSTFGSMDLYEIEKPEVDLAEGERNVIMKIVKDKLKLRTWQLVEQTHEEGRAWARVYRDGLGNRHVIDKKELAEYGGSAKSAK